MSPEECVKRGDLAGALAELQARVRHEPASAPARVFLFELLAVLGQWDRSRAQLKIAGELDASLLLTVNGYSAALEAERARAVVFRGEQAPLLLGQPPAWLGPLIEARRLTAVGAHEAAGKLREQALEQATAVPGVVNGEPFEWITDADPRIGPCLEAIVEGRYYWVPLENVRELRSEPPAHLRDLVWMPAQVEWTNGGRSPVLIPTRYPGTETAEDNALKLARATRWDEPAPGVALGLGQRVYATDAQEIGICEIRRLRLGADAQAGDEGPSGATDG